MTYGGSGPSGGGYPGMPGQQPPYLPPQVNYQPYANGDDVNGQYQTYASAFAPQQAQYYTNDAATYTSYGNGFNAATAFPPPIALQHQPQQYQSPVSASHPRFLPVAQTPRMASGPPAIASVTPSDSSPRILDERKQQLPAPARQRIASTTTVANPRPASTSRSPAVAQSAAPRFDTISVLVCVAEDCFAKAANAASDLSRRLDEKGVREYHKLISTGLGCLDAVLQSNKLQPRLEARIRLRYATVLVEETENLTEAETALTKGMALCDKHRLLDLRYCMQYLLIQVLFRRHMPSAAHKAVDGAISHSRTDRHVPWIYAFHFLKASFYLQSSKPAETHAISNLRTIGEIASERQDHAIAVVAALLEGLTHLLTSKDDATMKLQACLAQAAKYQLDDSVKIPQLETLASLLDLVCGLQQKTLNASHQKLAAFQSLMESHKGDTWDSATTELLLPINKHKMTSSTVTADTRAIIRAGAGEHDFLVMTVMSKPQAFALGFACSGLATAFKPGTPGRSLMYWKEALSILDQVKKSRSRSALTLNQAVNQRQWEVEFRCYMYVMMGLHAVTLTDWTQVEFCINKTKTLGASLSRGILHALILYLDGAYRQAIGDGEGAMRVFDAPRFALDSEAIDATPAEQAVSILAALNKLWIMYDPQHANQEKTTALLDQLQLLCEGHPDKEVAAAYNLVLATIHSRESVSINVPKRYIQQALVFLKQTNNPQGLAVALNLMRWKLFDKVMGEQATKSALAAQAQARKSGNLVWMSVAEGLLAESLDMQGDAHGAQEKRRIGTHYANQAFGTAKS